IYDLNREFNWSGDSKWVAFEKFLPNRLRAITIYSVESGNSVQITDGMSDARRPVFDRDGQYLYFTASTNYGPTNSGLDMISDEHEVTSSIYLAVLPNNIPSPLAPESDEEGAPGPKGTPAADGGRGGRGGNRAAGSGSRPDVPAFSLCWSRRRPAVAEAAAAPAAVARR